MDKLSSVAEVKTLLGDRVRQLRVARGWTQSILAQQTELSAKFIGQIERAETNPSMETLHALSCAFEVQIGELFEDRNGGENDVENG